MKTRIAAVALVALLALTGCAGATEPADEQRVTTTESETAAPLVAAEPTEDATTDDAEAAFLTYVRENLPTPTSIPDATDDQLLAAGQDACARLAAGESADGMVVVEGEQPWENGYYYDSSAIVGGASRFLCAA